MEKIDLFLSPVIQYGFAGFCVLLLLHNFWLTNKFMNMQKESQEKILKALNKNTEINSDLHAVLSFRPCLYNDSKFKK